ncbi:MAG: restriction endonuclease subunit S [Phocaeicola sp.]|uniref:restriction endonuclease subunit S n=1 Tax=Phocaeicola sp. TaxID=2773926 RepID=UPI00300F4568
MVFTNSLSSYYEKFLATGEVKCIDEEIPFEIPATWEWCRLGYIFSHCTGKALNGTNRKGNLYTYITTSNLYWDRFELSSLKEMYFTEEELGKCTATKGDLLVCEGGDIGRSAIWNYDYNIRIQNHIHKLRSYIPLCTRFFYYVMYLYKGIGYIGGKGIGIQGLSSGALHNILIPTPSINEQERIVSQIEAIMPIAAKYEKSQEELNQLNDSIHNKLRKSILQEAIQGKLVPQITEEGTAKELLAKIRKEKEHLAKEGKLKKSALTDSIIYKGDDNKYYEQVGKKCLDITEQIPFEIPENWVWVRMGQIGDWGAGSTPQRGNANYYNGKILWLKTGELNNGIVYDTEEKVTQKAFQDYSLRMNKIGDVLIAMYGATIGKLAIVGKELTTNQACCGCTPYLIYNWYLFYFLMASRDSFIKKGEGGAQPNISRVKLVEHLIPLPPLKEQYRIVAQIEKLFEQLR